MKLNLKTILIFILNIVFAKMAFARGEQTVNLPKTVQTNSNESIYKQVLFSDLQAFRTHELIGQIASKVVSQYSQVLETDRRHVLEIFRRLASSSIVDTSSMRIDISKLELPDRIAAVRSEFSNQISNHGGEVLNNCYFNYPTQKDLRENIGFSSVIDSQMPQLVIDRSNSMSQLGTEFCALFRSAEKGQNSIIIAIDLNSELRSFPTCKIDLNEIEKTQTRKFGCQERSLQIMARAAHFSEFPGLNIFARAVDGKVRDYLLDNFKPVGRSFEKRKAGMPQLCVRNSRLLERKIYGECG